MQLTIPWDSLEDTLAWLEQRMVSTRGSAFQAPRWGTSAARDFTLGVGTTLFKYSLAQLGGKWTYRDFRNADVRNLSIFCYNSLVAARECLEGPDLGVGQIFNHSWTDSVLFNTEIRCKHFWFGRRSSHKYWIEVKSLNSRSNDGWHSGTHAPKERPLTLCMSNL